MAGQADDERKGTALAEVTKAQHTIEQAQVQLEDAAVRAVEWGASAREVAEARGIANPAWVYAVLRRADRAALIAPYERRTGGRAQTDA